jgi:hypothetical protein
MEHSRTPRVMSPPVGARNDRTAAELALDNTWRRPINNVQFPW